MTAIVRLHCDIHGPRPTLDLRYRRCLACHPRRPVGMSPATFARARDVAERVRNGDHPNDIARQLGVSRERVRQLHAAIAPGLVAEGRAARHALASEQRRVRAEVQLVTHALRVGPCPVCDGPVPPPRDRTCSAECAKLWVQVGYHLDPHRRVTHQRAMARWTLANSTDPTQRRSARRVLAGTARTHGRWVLSDRVRRDLERVGELRAAVAVTGETWWHTDTAGAAKPPEDGPGTPAGRRDPGPTRPPRTTP
jgi:hypothetical protein